MLALINSLQDVRTPESYTCGKRKLLGKKLGLLSLEEKVGWKSQAAFQYLNGAYREARKGV